VSWFLGARMGAMLALLAGALVLNAQLGDGLPSGAEAGIVVWSLASVLALFAAVALLPARVQRLVLEQSRLARQDVLTHMPNRLSFNERLPLELSAAAGRRAP